jgi:hypothetical protein
MMDARSAEEGRSFLSRKGGGTRLGEALFDEKVTVYSDPNDPIAPEPVFGEDGLPQRRTVWIDGGIVRNLVRSRFWAKKTGRDQEPFRSEGGFTRLNKVFDGKLESLLADINEETWRRAG